MMSGFRRHVEKVLDFSARIQGAHLASASELPSRTSLCRSLGRWRGSAFRRQPWERQSPDWQPQQHAPRP